MIKKIFSNMIMIPFIFIGLIPCTIIVGIMLDLIIVPKIILILLRNGFNNKYESIQIKNNSLCQNDTK